MITSLLQPFSTIVVATTEGGCMSLYASSIIITLLKPTLFAFYCWK
ncbi:hypothetical protein HanHA300_Chr09g0317161 [Helianthus annuus]|nr:hypothetical protein HanHA300_Chr09g0317161 [Helianthus annuus]KAJ0707330.1 hypothetical protein HanLR1_Chr09g0317271 [Helianthus annuus]